MTSARDEAISRLMSICPHPTPDERRIYAEWIVDAILAASVERNEQVNA